METPSEVKQAVVAILATLAISTFLALYQKLSGSISGGQFIGTIIIYAFFCILPYKISNKSNPARYIYLLITIVTLLTLFAVDYKKYKMEFIVSFILIPIEVFIIYRLFQKKSSSWFRSEKIRS